MAKYEQRSSDQLIANLEARIAGIKVRAERKKAKATPGVKFTLGAVKLIDKALAASSDQPTRLALQEAHGPDLLRGVAEHRAACRDQPRRPPHLGLRGRKG